MKISSSKIFGYVLVLFSLIFGAVFLKNQNEILNSILSINTGGFFILVLLVLVTLVLNGLKIYWLQKIFDLDLKIIESISLASVNAMWNYLPFTGGLIVRGAYLKKKYKFPWAKFIATIAASFLISMVAFGLVGLLVTLSLINDSRLIFSSVFVGLILAPIFFFQFQNYLRRLDIKIVNDLLEYGLDFKLLTKNRSIFFTLFFIDLVVIFVDSLRLFLAGQFSGNPVAFTTALLVTPLTILTSLVNITPGALVIREALITLTTSQLNYSIETGVVIATIDRAALVVGIFLSGIIGSIYLSKRLNEK